MTTEVMTDLEIKLANHIEKLCNDYPDVMRVYLEDDDVTEEKKLQWFIWHHLEFRLHDNVYGVCYECNTPAHVYQLHTTKPMPYTNETIVSEQWRCSSCAQQAWRAYHLMGYVARNIHHWALYPDELIPKPELPVPGIDNCGVCNRVIAELDWVNYNRLAWQKHVVYAAFKQEDIEAEPILRRVHTACAIQCDNCKSYYNGSTYVTSTHSRFRIDTVEGNRYCEFCADEWRSAYPDYVQCNEGCYVQSEDDLRWSDYRSLDLCVPCYDIELECDDCGSCYYEDDGHTCEDYDSDSNYPSSEYVHSYSYKPTPNFFGNGEYYMGIELEVEDTDNSYTYGAEIAFNAMNPSRSKKYRGYLKSDGSLSRGFEIVSHPHTLKEFQDNFPWQMLTDLKKLRFRSWNTSTCGLHVHVSRTAFEDENHQIRFVKLIYDNQRQVQRIAGRTSNYATFSDKGNIIPKVKFKNQSNGRYAAVNVEPEETIEVRVFRGSLHIPRVLSAIEFVDSVVQYTKELKIVPKDKPLSWVRYVGFISANSNKYPNLFDIINRSFDNESPSENVED